MRKSLACLALAALLLSGVVLVAHEHGPTNTDCRLCHAAAAPRLIPVAQLPAPPAPAHASTVEPGAGRPGGIATAPIACRAPPSGSVTV